jgi:hypothetical protein
MVRHTAIQVPFGTDAKAPSEGHHRGGDLLNSASLGSWDHCMSINNLVDKLKRIVFIIILLQILLTLYYEAHFDVGDSSDY